MSRNVIQAGAPRHHGTTAADALVALLPLDGKLAAVDWFGAADLFGCIDACEFMH